MGSSLKRVTPTAIVLLLALAVAVRAEPLGSWNDGPAKQRIIGFVSEVVKTGGANYVAPEDRIAVFDNDGTLWAEQPLYFQFVFAIDRVKSLAPQHPEWKTTQPFKAVLQGDQKALIESGEKGLAKILAATNTGMTTDEYTKIVSSWLWSARHPRCSCPYTDLVYQPMVEVLFYLRDNGFKTYIVSGGTVDFIRSYAQAIYGIPPEQVIGTSFNAEFKMGADGVPVIVRLPELDFLDDGPNKPVAIEKFIGRRPVLAFGNSDGDLQMLRWTASGQGPRFMALVHHTDAEREWAYDRKSHIGQLDQALDEASAKGWLVVDMKQDWRQVFARDASPPRSPAQGEPTK